MSLEKRVEEKSRNMYNTIYDIYNTTGYSYARDEDVLDY